MLRAIGLSVRQMAAALALEQVFLITFTGLAAGTGISLLAAYLFIPFLPVNTGAHAGVPPYVVAIAERSCRCTSSLALCSWQAPSPR